MSEDVQTIADVLIRQGHYSGTEDEQRAAALRDAAEIVTVLATSNVLATDA